ncbi:MAG TPA: hypothetical protein VFK88_12025 [Gallionella sp.]|nr:hypothetical protein [Gallionella sp.]
MENSANLEAKFQKMQQYVKYGGLAIVAVMASITIAVAGTSVVVAAVTAIIALAMVNLLPVLARQFALWRQKAMTHLAETFSEETIREDERNEGERIRELEGQYKASRSELEGAMEELHGQMATCTTEERNMLQSQIDSIILAISDAEESLMQRKQDYVELQRVNKLYIAFHRSASAMEKAQGAERDPAELQSLETARASIKTRMRSAMAGKTIESMNKQINASALTVKTAGLGNSMQSTRVNKEKLYAVQDRG